MKAIGLDIGTTSVCAVLIDSENGEIINKLEMQNDTWIPTENEWEKIQDPDKILKKATDILDMLYCDDVAAIGITGQMHGIVYLDRNGNAVSPLYTWQDGRGSLRYGSTTYAESIDSYTGYGYVTHTYNRINDIIPDKAAVFCTIHDYVAMKICGLEKPLIHSSDAASFGQYDVSENRFTVNDPFLPQITSKAAILGRYKSAPVCAALGDNQASFIGSGGGEGSVLVNVGTGSQVSAESGHAADCNGIETRPYTDNKYLWVSCSLCGGKTYAVLENFLRSTAEMITGHKTDSVYDIMNRVLENKTEAALVVDNRFMGTRAQPQLRGAISNISAENFTPQELIVATVEAMADELYNMYKAMNIECTRLIASGNGLRKNKALARKISEKFGMPLNIPLHKEEASFGAALFALVGTGAYANTAEAQKIIRFGSD